MNQIELTPGFGAAAEEFFGVDLGDLLFVQELTLKVEEIALFGELTFAITDRLSATAGLRWFDIDVNDAFVADGLFNDGPSAGAAQSSDSGLNPRFNVTFEANEDLLLFFTAARGFRRGGPNGEVPLDLWADDLADLGITETLWNYEVGVKGSLADNRIVFNLAGFVTKWKNVQQSIPLRSCLFSFTDNASEASGIGFEAELFLRPTDRVDVRASVGFVNSELDQDATFELGPTAVKGAQLILTPKWTFSLSGQYTVPLANAWEAFVRADYQYIDEASLNFFGDPITGRRPAYDLAAFQVGILAERWELTLFMNNALNERPRLNAFLFGTADAQLFTLRPRTFGAEIRTDF